MCPLQGIPDGPDADGPAPGDRPYAAPTLTDHIIPTKNPPALISYYCGVFSLGPAAIVLGIMGLRSRRAHPNLPGKGHAVTGIVLGTLTTLVYWGFVIAAVIAAFPNR